ncbi:TRAP transporter small permease [Fulvimarina sp. 2208YS6-2-32]|uniref:TRAP transporter small permease protein n=1 Tax=Fulvimarina uroteuthidis TaxID=3098149 RepID=A0ABU5I1H9_9HYPH|nr:TRAP transporter small permease [Fulvimarina sp. 2208YS6-2-32]MDY8108940.1 TRAP transporter small permease [Fulvimarina sp. 2208YS6-2-32]
MSNLVTMPDEPPADPLPRGLARIVAALDALASLLMAISGVMMVTLIAIFGWLVFGRYVLNNTPTWVEQAAILLIVWITFLGSSVGVWRSTHLSIDFVREALPEGPREILRVATDVGLVVFGGYMCWYGAVLALNNARRVMPMLGISEGWRGAPLSLCGALVVLFALARLAIHVVTLARSRTRTRKSA